MPRTLHQSPGQHVPLTDAAAALHIVALAASVPPQPETVVLLLDDAHVGRTCVVVDGTTQPDDVIGVASLVAEAVAHSSEVHAVVLATLRPARGRRRRPPADAGDADVDRWLELLDLFDEVGVDLLDWFVVDGRRADSLREIAGMPSLWRGP